VPRTSGDVPAASGDVPFGSGEVNYLASVIFLSSSSC